MEKEVVRLKKKVNELRRTLKLCDEAGVSYDKSPYGGYLWRAVMDLTMNEQDEDYPGIEQDCITIGPVTGCCDDPNCQTACIDWDMISELTEEVDQ
jgi:hypothetical protein